MFQKELQIAVHYPGIKSGNSAIVDIAFLYASAVYTYLYISIDQLICDLCDVDLLMFE